MSSHFICSFRNQSGFMPYFIFFKPLCPFHLFLTQIFSDRFPRGEKLGRIERWKHSPSVSGRCLSPCVHVLCQIPFLRAWRNLCQILIHQSHRRLNGSESEQWESTGSRRAQCRGEGFFCGAYSDPGSDLIRGKMAIAEEASLLWRWQLSSIKHQDVPCNYGKKVWFTVPKTLLPFRCGWSTGLLAVFMLVLPLLGEWLQAYGWGVL